MDIIVENQRLKVTFDQHRESNKEITLEFKDRDHLIDLSEIGKLIRLAYQAGKNNESIGITVEVKREEHTTDQWILGLD